MKKLTARFWDSFSFRVMYYFKNADRKRQLNNSVANKLKLAELDSLELLNICSKNSKIHSIYDIGANIGTWAVLSKAIFPESIINCFEPLAIHMSGFKQNTQRLGQIYFHQIALGRSNACKKMYVTSQTDSSSLLPITNNQSEVFGITEKEECDVNVFSLDDYVMKNNLPPPDIMKLDIQGYELEALKGAETCIKNCRYIILEVSFIEFYKGQPLFEEVIDYMFRREFRAVAFGFNTATGMLISQTDVLFANTKC